MKEKHAPLRHSVWLCAAGPLQTEISNLIAQFTDLSKTPVFEPHVTLLGDIQGDPQQTAMVCRHAFKAYGAIHGHIRGVAQTDAYYMSLFLELQVPDALLDARAQCCADLGRSSTEPYRPHVSLAYGLAQKAVPKETIARVQAQCVGRDIVLTEAVVVASAQDIPIDQWQRLVSFRL